MVMVCHKGDERLRLRKTSHLQTPATAEVSRGCHVSSVLHVSLAKQLQVGLVQSLSLNNTRRSVLELAVAIKCRIHIRTPQDNRLTAMDPRLSTCRRAPLSHQQRCLLRTLLCKPSSRLVFSLSTLLWGRQTTCLPCA